MPLQETELGILCQTARSLITIPAKLEGMCQWLQVSGVVTLSNHVLPPQTALTYYGILPVNSNCVHTLLNGIRLLHIQSFLAGTNQYLKYRVFLFRETEEMEQRKDNVRFPMFILAV